MLLFRQATQPRIRSRRHAYAMIVVSIRVSPRRTATERTRDPLARRGCATFTASFVEWLQETLGRSIRGRMRVDFVQKPRAGRVWSIGDLGAVQPSSRKLEERLGERPRTTVERPHPGRRLSTMRLRNLQREIIRQMRRAEVSENGDESSHHRGILIQASGKLSPMLEHERKLAAGATVSDASIHGDAHRRLTSTRSDRITEEIQSSTTRSECRAIRHGARTTRRDRYQSNSISGHKCQPRDLVEPSTRK